MPLFQDLPYSSRPLLATYAQILQCELLALHPTAKNVRVGMSDYTTELLDLINEQFTADRQRLAALESSKFTAEERAALEALIAFHNVALHSVIADTYNAIKTVRAQTVDMHVAMSNLTDAITDTNVGIAAYFRATEAKAITALKFTLLEPTTAGVFSVMMKINDVDVFVAPVEFTIGADTAAYTIPLNVARNENVIDMPANAKVTLHIVSAGTGAKAAVATFTLKNPSVYDTLTDPTWADI